MSESNNYEPAPWSAGRSFSTAYQQYEKDPSRDYNRAQAEGKTASKLLPTSITTSSEYPGVVDVDGTGSMQGWDATIASKLPYLEHEMTTEYYGPDAELSFGRHTDSEDTYPLQVRPFAKGADMEKRMKELIPSPGGAGSDRYHEAHGLPLLYRARNTHMPRSLIKPPYVLITDEMPHPRVSKESAMNSAKVKIEKAMSIREIVEEVKLNYALYLVLKPYDTEQIVGDKLQEISQRVYDTWAALVGEDHIALLPHPDRVVDVIFGIWAKETGKIDYFRDELEKRQLPDVNGKKKVETVYKSLSTIHKIAGPKAGPAAGSSPSKMSGLGKGTRRTTE